MSLNNSKQAEILIVEDDQDIREALCEFLIGEGFKVASAHNGQDALERLQRGLLPKLIFLDLTMPVMDGASFLQARKKEALNLQQIPVLAFSAVGAHPNIPEITEFLKKPVDLEDILSAVQRYCATSAA